MHELMSAASNLSLMVAMGPTFVWPYRQVVALSRSHCTVSKTGTKTSDHNKDIAAFAGQVAKCRNRNF